MYTVYSVYIYIELFASRFVSLIHLNLHPVQQCNLIFLMESDYPVILRIFGFFRPSLSRTIHHPWLQISITTRPKE